MASCIQFFFQRERQEAQSELIVRVNEDFLLLILRDLYETIPNAVTILVRPQSFTSSIIELPRASSMPLPPFSPQGTANDLGVGYRPFPPLNRYVSICVD